MIDLDTIVRNVLKALGRKGTLLDKEDLYQEGMCLAIETSIKIRNRENAGYVFVTVKSELFRYLLKRTSVVYRKSYTHIVTVNIDYVESWVAANSAQPDVAYIEAENAILYNKWRIDCREVLTRALNMFLSAEREIICRLYGLDYIEQKPGEVAEIMAISVTMVYYINARLMRILRKSPEMWLLNGRLKEIKQ